MVKVSNIIIDKKVCLIDSSHETYCDKKGYIHWYRYKTGWICSRCHNKLVTNPKFHPIYNPIFRSRCLLFKGKHILLEKNPRTGYCSWCTNNIYDGSCKRTSIHHVEYDDKNILANTIEICNSCHAYETNRLKTLN